MIQRGICSIKSPKYIVVRTTFHVTETECSGEGYFRCDNDRCFPDYVVCDEHDDCGDGSDEVGCGMTD